MDELKVPNVEQMDERQARRFLEGMMSDLGADSGYEVRHDTTAKQSITCPSSN